jgi:hypothetical protein
VLLRPTLTEGVSAFVDSLAKDRDVSVKEMEAEVIKTLRPSLLIKLWATPEEVANPVGCISAARPPQQRPVQRFGWMAAWCAASPSRSAWAGNSGFVDCHSSA